MGLDFSEHHDNSEAVEGPCACSPEGAGGTQTKASSAPVMAGAGTHLGHVVMSRTRAQLESSQGPLAMPSGVRGGRKAARPSNVGVLLVL